jgi:hypothetical protein
MGKAVLKKLQTEHKIASDKYGRLYKAYTKIEKSDLA